VALRVGTLASCFEVCVQIATCAATQRLYLSEQTDGSPSHPNTLHVVNADVIQKRVAAAEHMMFNEVWMGLNKCVLCRTAKTFCHSAQRQVDSSRDS
jgi:hypothetical protein